MKTSGKLFIVLVFLLPVFGRCDYDLPVTNCFKPFSMPDGYLMQMNIDEVLSIIMRNIEHSPERYASHIAGSGSNAIYGHAQCPAYILQVECYLCILDAIHKLLTDCHTSAEAEVWYERCLLRYDSTNFFNQVVQGPVISWSSEKHRVDYSYEFIQTVNRLMTAATMKAITAPNRFANMQAYNSKNNMNVYGMVQCTGDLQLLQCNHCLNLLVKAISSHCAGGAYSDCGMSSASCMLRYIGVYPIRT